jgi:hypothetical protein
LIEAGERTRIEFDTVHALARVLGVDVLWLGAGKGEVPSREQVLSAVERARAASEPAAAVA